ncbi:hypothetical protein [Saccharibacillus kuerlensis]|uniref:DUF4258 domain-containing protein n=1 Tax=Saccharibacillus kuerlensis TaxID=459527 RepID=A0ABQ2L0F3_9BACL|nr:hypothetical protein [Saccharibacillus kuerlensis]GGN98669.1 hypothetical protein GCM10010969_17990 [Saccharibacillus kuerlensis]
MIKSHELDSEIIAAHLREALERKRLLFTERAERDMERAHFDGEMLSEFLRAPRRIDKYEGRRDNGCSYILYGERTTRAVVSVHDGYVTLVCLKHNPFPAVG